MFTKFKDYLLNSYYVSKLSKVEVEFKEDVICHANIMRAEMLTISGISKGKVHTYLVLGEASIEPTFGKVNLNSLAPSILGKVYRYYKKEQEDLAKEVKLIA